MILYLTGPKGITPALQAILGRTLSDNGVPAGSVMFYSLHRKVPNLAEYTKKKGGIPHEANLSAARHTLSQQCEVLKPNLIVVNDEASLRTITQQPYTLATTRGSIYQFSGLPVLVLDDLHHIQYDPIAKFQLQFDLAKLVRFALGRQKRYPKFDYQLCTKPEEVAFHCARAERATFVATDTETAAKFITVVSYTYDHDGALCTFAVPFFDNRKPQQSYWNESDEIAIRNRLAKLNASTVRKGMHNGGYDCAYFMKEQMPPVNYYVDSQVMMHSIWIEAPKKLHEVSSYFLDNYTYWKDDGKGIKEEGYKELEKYWRYCGLDSYFTYLSCTELLGRIKQMSWAMENYRKTFALYVGPCLESSLTGMPIDKDAHATLMEQQMVKAQQGISDIRALTHEPDFRMTPRQVAWFLYDFCHQKPTRLQWTDPTRKNRKKYGPRSTDEKVLKIMREQNNGLSCIARNFIDRVLRAKKPANVLSNYQNLAFLTMRDRFCHWHNAVGTDTFRFATGSNQFWLGRNSQNIPGWLREWIRADQDWVFYSVDYSASDDRFIAYESEDPAKMELVESGKDPHCFHASVFFSFEYELLVKGWKGKEPWVIHPTRGVRQNTKRVTHGRNFRMEAMTMYNTMGRDAVVATAVALGYPKAAGWSDKELIGICQILIEKYDNPKTGLYKRLRPWGDETVELAKKNGNRFTNTFGYTRWFLGSMDNPDVQRALASCYGQMGTAGNINVALLKMYYGGTIDNNCRFLQQGHDSLLMMIHKSVIHEKVPEIVRIMEEKFEIHGRKLRIPVDGKLGLRWSEDMVGYTPELTYEDIVKFDNDTFAKKYPRRKAGTDAMLEALAGMNFADPGTPETGEMPSEFETEDNSEESEELELA